MGDLFGRWSAERMAERMAAGNADASRKWSSLKGLFNAFTVSGSETVSLNSLTVPDTSGSGIKVGDEAAQAFGWRDITSNINVRGVAATDPAWTQVGSSGLYAYDFDINDVVWLTFHIPHDIASSTVYFHVHWFPSGTNANSVKWEFKYVYAKGFDQQAFGFGSPTTITVEQASPEVAYQHMVAETTGQTISGLTEPDGLIHLYVKRITNGATDNSDSIFGLTADIHYQSTNMATVNKAPSFYG